MRARDESSHIDQLLAPLRQEPDWAKALELLIKPIARKRKLLAPDPAGMLREVAAWAARLPDSVLEATAYRILEERHSAVSENDIVVAARAVQGEVGRDQVTDRPGAPAVQADGLSMITERQHPRQFAAWLAHYEALSRTETAVLEDGRSLRHVLTVAIKHRALRVPSPYPPVPPTGAQPMATGTTVHWPEETI